MSAEIIDWKAWREAVAAEATNALREVLSNAAALCAAGELSAEGRAALPFDLFRTYGFGDGVGWSFAKYTRADAAKPDDVLHRVLSIAAEEAATRVLSAEGRAILLNAAFLALGNGWRVERVV